MTEVFRAGDYRRDCVLLWSWGLHCNRFQGHFGESRSEHYHRFAIQDESGSSSGGFAGCREPSLGRSGAFTGCREPSLGSTAQRRVHHRVWRLLCPAYILYAWQVRTRLVTLVGGLALILIPAVPYTDLFFFSVPGEARFALLTAPIVAVLASVVLVGVDNAIRPVRTGRLHSDDDLT